MIRGIRVDTLHEDKRVMYAIKERNEDDCEYLIELKPNERSLNKNNLVTGKALLKSERLESPNLISYDFALERGLYDVTVARITERNGKMIKTAEAEKYPEPVMVGNKYVLKVKINDAECYGGVSGARIRMSSAEMGLTSKDVYYKIKIEEIKDIKYYIPFDQTSSIDFFVKGVQKNDIELYLENSSFEIQMLEN